MNPYTFAMNLFTAAKSGPLDIPPDELEDHLTKISSDHPEGSPTTTNRWYSIIRRARNPFQGRWAQAARGPRVYSQQPMPLVSQGWMASSSSCKRLSWNSSSVFYKEPGGKDTSHRNGQRQANGDWIPKEENSVRVGSFRPISLLNALPMLRSLWCADRMGHFCGPQSPHIWVHFWQNVLRIGSDILSSSLQLGSK